VPIEEFRPTVENREDVFGQHYDRSQAGRDATETSGPSCQTSAARWTIEASIKDSDLISIGLLFLH
jgi:hypothetical protein